MKSPRPFQVAASEAKLTRIRTALQNAELPPAPNDDTGWTYGCDVGYLKTFIAYWLDEYDWRAREAELNQFPQFTALIDGVDIHFYHVRSREPNAQPLILTHGWPGSVVEFLHLIGPLTDPVSFGGDASDAFDVVIPSLPGFGFSGHTKRPIGPRAIAQLWRTLMTDTLGYAHFGAQGGDFGSSVSMWLGEDHASVVDGVHLNFCTVPFSDDPSISDAQRQWQIAYRRMLDREGAYMFEHMTKPQTVATVLSSSPVALTAWVLEKFQSWGDTGGDIESRFSKDLLITNLMTYLIGGSAGTALWLYRGAAEERAAGAVTGARVSAPTGVALFPGEFLPPPPRDVVERHYNLHRWTQMESGGHFAALEEPEAFLADVRAFFRPLRSMHP